MQHTRQYTRQNVWELGGDWADPILWYARGVREMKARALVRTDELALLRQYARHRSAALAAARPAEFVRTNADQSRH